MEAIESKLCIRAFRFIGEIYLIYNMDFTEAELENLTKKGWKQYRRYWHYAPKGWSPAKK